MKSYGKYRRFFYKAAGYVNGGCAIIGSLVGMFLSINLNEAELGPFALWVLRNLHAHAFVIYGIIGFLLAISWVYRWFGNPWIWQKLKFILDQYQNQCFKNGGGDPQDHHRVTLFKRKWCVFRRHWTATKWYKPWGTTPPFSHYLVPVLRSGHLSQNQMQCSSWRTKVKKPRE